jgi:hypothetical protein
MSVAPRQKICLAGNALPFAWRVPNLATHLLLKLVLKIKPLALQALAAISVRPGDIWSGS